MKRTAAAVAVLAMFAGAIAISSGGAGAQVGDAAEVVDQEWVDVPAGVTRWRVHHILPSEGSDWYQLVFTPRKPVVFGFKELEPGVGVLTFSEPTESRVRLDFSVLRYEP